MEGNDDNIDIEQLLKIANSIAIDNVQQNNNTIDPQLINNIIQPTQQTTQRPAQQTQRPVQQVQRRVVQPAQQQPAQQHEQQPVKQQPVEQQRAVQQAQQQTQQHEQQPVKQQPVEQQPVEQQRAVQPVQQQTQQQEQQPVRQQEQQSNSLAKSDITGLQDLEQSKNDINNNSESSISSITIPQNTLETICNLPKSTFYFVIISITLGFILYTFTTPVNKNKKNE